MNALLSLVTTREAIANGSLKEQYLIQGTVVEMSVLHLLVDDGPHDRILLPLAALTWMYLKALRSTLRLDVFFSSTLGMFFFNISKHSFKCARLEEQKAQTGELSRH